jgi:leucyl aminopeptidase (aminopeptidase T)
VTFDSALLEGARNIVHRSLSVQQNQRVLLITDEATEEVAAAIAYEINVAGATYSPLVLEEMGARPFTGLPAELIQHLSEVDACILAFSDDPDERAGRGRIAALAHQNGARVANLVSVDRYIMLEGMRADYDQLDRFASSLIEQLATARTLRADSPAQTDITVQLQPGATWSKFTGPIESGATALLPPGLIWGPCESVDGVYAADGVAGGPLSARFGELRYTPLVVTLQAGRVVDVTCENPRIKDDFTVLVDSGATSGKVTEILIGTNYMVSSTRGKIAQDSKIPGVYLRFGQGNDAIELVARYMDAWIDGRHVMHNAQFMTAAET